MKRDAIGSPSAAAPIADFARLSAQARQAGVGFIATVADHLGIDVYEATRQVAGQSGLPYLPADALHTMQPAFDLLGFAELERTGVLLARAAPAEAASAEIHGTASAAALWLIIEDPFDSARLDWAESRIPLAFSLALAAPEDIRAELKRHEATLRAVASVLPDMAPPGVSFAAHREELSLGRIAADASPVVRLVNSMLYDALKALASDVHLETDANGVAIKYRIDGVLDAAGRIDDPATGEQVISRIKVLAELDIAEKRVPQDGRFQVRIDGRDIDLRVSIMPAVHGEDAVVRILDRQRLADEARGLRFESLGFDAASIVQLRRLSRLPYGLLLVTGPTGSGKTTTLYAALSEISTGADKVVTIEDPVEYQLPGAVQIPVNEKRGLTFSRGLRSILRHDPDKIMVGEIRDGETAQIAVQAALTGHLVFTTVHANNVFDVIGRLLHIGVDPFNLVAALNAVAAQRLVRIVCSHCAVADPVDLSDRLPAEQARLRAAGVTLKVGRGCGHCRGSGYRGRRAVAEVLVFDDALRELITSRAPMSSVKRAARERGMRSMRQNGLDLVAQGLTTLVELDRVSFAEAEHA